MTASTSTTGHRAAVAAGFLGWTLDAFDFFLVVLALTSIAKDFHRPDRDVALSLTLTLAFRPVGAFVFGLLADRFGRRLPLMLDLVFYSVCEVASAFAPNFTVFLVLRALFGIGMGGEWGLGASLAMEKAPKERRGLLSGLLQEGYAAGFLLAAVAYYFVFPRFGWRPLFLLGGLPALLALFVRARVEESEVWRKSRPESFREIGRTLLTNWKTFLFLVVLMTGMNLSSHGTQDMFPTFLQRGWHLGPHARSLVTAASMVGAIAGGLLFGRLSDRLGRRRAMVLALVGAVLVIPLWAFSPTMLLLVAGAVLMQLFVQGAWGVVPAHISELSPDSVRGVLPGFAYQCGVLLASSIGYVESTLATRMSYQAAMAGSAALVLVFAAVVVALGREKHGATFGGETEAAPTTEKNVAGL